MNTFSQTYSLGPILQQLRSNALFLVGSASHLLAPYPLTSVAAALAQAILPEQRAQEVIGNRRAAMRRDTSPSAYFAARHGLERQATRSGPKLLAALVSERAENDLRALVQTILAQEVRKAAQGMGLTQFLNFPVFYAGSVRPDLVVKKAPVEVVEIVGMHMLCDHILLDMESSGDASVATAYAIRTLESVRRMAPEIFTV